MSTEATMRYAIIAIVITLLVSIANADQNGARPAGAPNPPPATIPNNTTITPGPVGGTQWPGTNPNTGPTNPSQAPSPSAPGVIVVIPTR
jgi:hypothetical protein